MDRRIKMNTYIKLFGKEYTKKEFYIKAKKYIEKHTALVTTIISGIITITALFLNLLYASYKVGELAYFNVNTSYAFTQDKNSIMLKILIYLGIASIFILTNFLGYLSYIRRFFIKYFLILTFILIVLFYVVLTAICGIDEIFNEFFDVFLMISFYSFFFAISLTGFSIAYMFSPLKKDKIERLELKERKLMARNKLTDKKKNKINKKIESINQSANKKEMNANNSLNEKSNQNQSKIFLFIKPIIIVCYIGIVIVTFLLFGYSQSGNKTSFDTVSINSLSNLHEISFIEYDFDNYIILFENSEYMIISPYVTEQNEKEINETIVFTSLQIKIDNNNIPKINKSIKNITVNSNADDLENYKV